MTAASDISAFPATWGQFNEVGGQIAAEGGLTKREYFAAHAPIEYEEVARVFGAEITSDDAGRAAFFAVRALLAKEFADALIAALNEQPQGGE